MIYSRDGCAVSPVLLFAPPSGNGAASRSIRGSSWLKRWSENISLCSTCALCDNVKKRERVFPCDCLLSSA